MGETGMGIILIYLTFFGFLVLENNLEIFCVLEFRSFLLAFLYLKSSTKENFNALSYLFRFSCFLGLAYLRNALGRLVTIRMYNFLIRISIRVFIFFLVSCPYIFYIFCIIDFQKLMWKL